MTSQKKKEQIADRVIHKEYTNRIDFQSTRLTGTQSLLPSYQQFVDAGIFSRLKAITRRI